jgi:predicted nuclease of restriction endonuclease-like RecB superfamily
MLTKDLLLYTHRKGQIFPRYTDYKNLEAKEGVHRLLDFFHSMAGRRLKDIEDESSDLAGNSDLLQSLRKTLLDRCEFEDLSPDIVTQRWTWFRVAQEIRDEGIYFESQKDFEGEIERRISRPMTEVRREVFSDHPDEKKCLSFEKITPEESLHSLNRINLQSILFWAESLEYSVVGLTVAEKRSLFKRMKFFGVMGESLKVSEQNELVLKLSGPMDVFEKSQVYGGRLANFLIGSLGHHHWDIEAVIRIDQKRYRLKLDHKSAFQAIPSKLSGHVPDEFSSIKNFLEESFDRCSCDMTGELLNLGAEQYVVPDFTIKFNSRTYYLEIFHPWHSSQLESRLNSLGKSGNKHGLFLAVDRSLAKSKQLKSPLESDPVFAEFGLLFNGFPTPKQIATKLNFKEPG